MLHGNIVLSLFFSYGFLGESKYTHAILFRSFTFKRINGKIYDDFHGEIGHHNHIKIFSI